MGVGSQTSRKKNFRWSQKDDDEGGNPKKKTGRNHGKPFNGASRGSGPVLGPERASSVIIVLGTKKKAERKEPIGKQ